MSLLDNAFDAPVSSVLMVLLIFMYCKFRWCMRCFFKLPIVYMFSSACIKRVACAFSVAVGGLIGGSGFANKVSLVVSDTLGTNMYIW